MWMPGTKCSQVSNSMLYRGCEKLHKSLKNYFPKKCWHPGEYEHLNQWSLTGESTDCQCCHFPFFKSPLLCPNPPVEDHWFKGRAWKHSWQQRHQPAAVAGLYQSYKRNLITLKKRVGWGGEVITWKGKLILLNKWRAHRDDSRCKVGRRIDIQNV